MTIRDLINSGIEIQGHVQIIEYDENTDTTRILEDTYNINHAIQYIDSHILYMYPDDNTLIIEIETF
jgi:hypothetical protein